MLPWRKRPAAPVSEPTPPAPTEKVALESLDLDAAHLLPQLAYLELAFFQSLSQAVMNAPTLQDKSDVSMAAGYVLDRHKKYVEQIETGGIDADTAMTPYASAIDRFERLVSGTTWHERVITAYVTIGMMHDFVRMLTPAVPERIRDAYVEISEMPWGSDELRAVLERAIAKDEGTAARLALWGRRLVGDTLLTAAAMVRHSLAEKSRRDIDPIFTKIVSAHSNRMSELGLTP